MQLCKEGFGSYYRDQLVAAVEKQLAAKQSRINDVDDPLDLSGMGKGQGEAGAFAMMMMHQTHTFSDQGGNDNEEDGTNASKLGGEAIDWDEIAVTLNNKFSPERLKTIYHELAAAKRIWTPEEDDRLIRAVIRLGPPEFQPNLWTMIKDAFGDDIRISEDYKSRWRVLDMPQLDREWDHSEKIKFWRRWTDYRKNDSLLSLPQFAETDATAAGAPSSPVVPSTKNAAKDSMWDVIAEGLEYRHGRDCELYFKRTTVAFPKDPEVFQYLVQEVANVYLKPLMEYWSPEVSKKLVATVNSFHRAGKVVAWKSVAKALGHQYTAAQCQARWVYWSQKQKESPDQSLLDQEPVENIESISPAETETAEASTSNPQPWTDQELKMLKEGVQKHGHNWTAIRNAFLPNRTSQMLHERYWRSQARKTGRFTEKERSLLEAAMETFGEADWGLIASQVPGRTANQCRNNWKYGRTHHVQKLDEPWTDKDRERLKLAVDRFGSKKWTLISEFVVGKTPAQCRMEWNEKLDPGVKRGAWSGKELDQLMERVETIMSRKEEEERRRIAKAEALGAEGDNKALVDMTPRYKGKRKVDWREVAKGMNGRTPEQCRLRFQINRELYYIQGDY
ncbi:Myb-like DNA-binding domain protein [Dissophora ornata]|nr:Myb-like DNA-binding domain protein [Dissophora ornata]